MCARGVAQWVEALLAGAMAGSLGDTRLAIAGPSARARRWAWMGGGTLKACTVPPPGVFVDKLGEQVADICAEGCFHEKLAFGLISPFSPSSN